MIRITETPLDLAPLFDALPPSGACATFVGRVRGDDGVSELLLEHYPGATERALEAIAAEAAERWKLADATIVHRVGAMAPGEALQTLTQALTLALRFPRKFFAFDGFEDRQAGGSGDRVAVQRLHGEGAGAIQYARRADRGGERQPAAKTLADRQDVGDETLVLEAM